MDQELVAFVAKYKNTYPSDIECFQFGLLAKLIIYGLHDKDC
jgi:hypothetical protein